MNRKTIKNSFSLSGTGLHTGNESRITVLPMDEDKGIIFRKKNGDSVVEIKAEVQYISDTNRSTSLEKDGNRVITTEHLMAAIYALEIDDIYIDLEGDEIPILDGTSRKFCDSLINAQIIEKATSKEFFTVENAMEFIHEETGSEYIVMPGDKFEASVMIDFGSSHVGQQYAEIADLSRFCDDYSDCRTFGFFHEVESLIDRGLIKGASIANSILIADKPISDKDLERFGKKVNLSNIKANDQGIISSRPMKFPNEPARHKLLDLVGDIALLGVQVKGRIIAKRPGHRANIEFCKFLKQKMILQKKISNKPVYDPNKPPVVDIKEIMEILPHKYPFLLVDKIIEISDTHVVGIKNLTYNEQLFQGHFPGNPIFPGVLQMEALAQTGGVFVIKSTGDSGPYDTYFLKMDNVKFKSMAVPGDTLIMRMKLLQPIRRGIVCMKGEIYIGDRLVSEGDLTASIVKKQNDK
jgi:UDP-3-O-[3-hydroxymyristoyl] N-acetylglucosamine deacetylase/3-hydroxyacyl-[acyl-carrier-protein] dehydratase